jgi:hypothetical protein
MSKISSHRVNKQTKRPRKKPSLVNKPEIEAGLYLVVYESLLGKCCAFVLLLVFMSQASYVAAAGVVEEPNQEANASIGSELLSATMDNEDNETAIEEQDLEDAEVSAPTASVAEDVVIAENEEFDNVFVLQDEINEENYSESVAVVEVEELHQSGSHPFMEEVDLVEEGDALSTEGDFGVEGQATVSVVANDSALLFNRSECTELSSGSFYCYQVPKDALGDALFAAPDEDGDLEIFFVRSGVQQQITSNQVDDAAPFYDEISNTIVWHRQIDDRFQIISYDVSTGRETQITNGIVNNMEPVRQGSYIAWQRWIDNNWHIVLFDGSVESVISRGSDHNVAPNLNGDLLIWNRHTATGIRTLEVYNLLSGSYFSLDDPDGLAVENPRMMLVYDTVQQNGELVTRGYDLSTGRFIDIDTKPRSLPSDIPKSEQTGETRALIQSKPGIKIFENNSDDEGLSVDDVPEENESDPFELDLRDIDPSDFVEVEDNKIEDLVLPQYSELSEDRVDIEDRDKETVKEAG